MNKNIIFKNLSNNIVYTCTPLNKESFTNQKPTIPGAILIYSCNKHINTRLKKFTLSKKEYNGWKVFIIIGDPFLNADYKIKDNFITLKCEDSYIHLTKKIILTFKVIFNMYNVTEGVLRCGDDLVFNEKKLEDFTKKTDKKDYMGLPVKYMKTITKVKDNFMPDYFNSHPHDLTNPLNGIPYSLKEMQKFNEIPEMAYVSGVLMYFSVNACKILIEHMSQINWNVFQKNEQFGYPYIIEDVAIGYMLNINNIYPDYYKIYTDNQKDLLNDDTSIALHTNEYKENFRSV